MSDMTNSSFVPKSVSEKTTPVFAIDTEQGALDFLLYVHRSSLTTEQKNTLRDLLFTYKNTADANSTLLHTTAKTYGIDVISHSNTLAQNVTEQKNEKNNAAQHGHSTLGITRPIPTFSVVNNAQTVSTLTPRQKKSSDIEPSEMMRKNIAPDIQPLSPLDNNAATDTSVIITSAKKTADDTNVSTAGNTEIHQTAGQGSQASNPSEVFVGSDIGNRIKEIKKEVNALVGNPVNLIDSHNEIGREYMTALLDAMKKNNGGTFEEVQQAMQRLEKAYNNVTEIMIDNEGISNQDVVTDSTLSAEAQHTSIPATNNSQHATMGPSELSDDQQNVSVNELDIASETPKKPVSDFDSVYQTHIATGEDVTLHAPQGATDSSVMKEPRSASASAKDASTSVASVDHVSTSSTVQKDNIEQASTMMSVAKQKQIKDLAQAQKHQEATTLQQEKVAAIASMDPLMTPEVTAGLEQLLSEWSLFKSSGLFGTGPNGINHPLYRQLSKLTMTAIVAGRFEGATPQIKRSITDYMNGWRYEEGILQEQGELFEHYLRRVIKHILDKRK